MSHNAGWEAEQAKKLIGYKIVGTVTDHADPPTYWGLMLQKGKRKPVPVWVDSDEEGNDCGHLSLEALPKEGGAQDGA